VRNIIQGGGSGVLPETGHRIGFLQGYQHYFQNMSPGARGFETRPALAPSGQPPRAPTSPYSPAYPVTPFGVWPFGINTRR
jgi:hypothetical protein